VHFGTYAIELLAYPGRVSIYRLAYQQFVAYGDYGTVHEKYLDDNISEKTEVWTY
jgi:hypothetical protein